MLPTYEAVLTGNRLEWRQDMPPKADHHHSIVVLVTILETTPDIPQPTHPGKRMAEALEKLARIHALSTITDPKQWERDLRQDRILPGRI